MHLPRAPWLAWPLAVALAGPTPARAAAPLERPAEGPLAVEAPHAAVPEDRSSVSGGRSGAAVPEDRSAVPGDRSDASVPEDRSPVPGGRSGADVPGDRSAVSGDSPVPEGPAAAIPPPAPRVPSPAAPLLDGGPEVVAVAVGLGPSAPGSKAERGIVDALERAVLASAAPRTQLRRLRAGAGDGASVCRERRDDLVLLVEYLPDRDGPVLLTRDCRLDRDLGIRGPAAAREAGLVHVLWEEHRALVQAGVQERRAGMSRKVRRGLVAGGAILAVGLAIGLVVANSLRRDTVVLTVGP